MQDNGHKSLVALLIRACVMMMAGIGSWTAAAQLNTPSFIRFVLFLSVLVIFVLAIIVCIDLFGNNRITIEGVLIERKDLFNGYRLRVRPEGSELLRTFRMNLKFTDSVSTLQLDERIAIRYYRLTGVVISVDKAPDR
ncbi:hypothetical protein [Paenibacillus xylaniclasticus]|uniref:hypothetical protein n=1 Tax=Paenibacillus xylaniclasticus TaxID=588083 RepID=UPI000FDC7241|nr:MULTISPECIES: hypothetical protein [Paenibacillus]GFN30488.1 hypothetical protein PCURB6_07480 [Paenibacillus curdlanolyticus]